MRHASNALEQQSCLSAETAGLAGRDPKPWPPPFKLNREMVEAMGGADSEGYRAFCAHACEAYNILRKSASLILSLFHLMAGAAIPDVRADPEKVILKLQVCRAPCTANVLSQRLLAQWSVHEMSHCASLALYGPPGVMVPGCLSNLSVSCR